MAAPQVPREQLEEGDKSYTAGGGGGGGGAGTVTSVDITPGAGVASSGGPITGSGAITIALAAIATQRLMANISGVSAAPSANTLTAILDSILGNTQGQLITRNAANWTVIGPGAAGTFLQSQGAGANLTYAAVAAGGGQVVNGVLTTESGVPFSTTDRTAQATLYFTPYQGNQITLWDGAAWTTYTFTEITLPLGTLTAFHGYDVFAYQSAGVVTLEMLAWRSASVTMAVASPGLVGWTSHGRSIGDPVVFTGSMPSGVTANVRYWIIAAGFTANQFEIATAPSGTAINFATSGSSDFAWDAKTRATAVTYQDGRLCKSGDKTRLYIGSFYTTSTTTTEDSFGGTVTQVGGKRMVYNYWNRRPLHGNLFDSTSSWLRVTASVWELANAAFANRCEFFIGIAETTASADAWMQAFGNNLTGTMTTGVGVNSITTATGIFQGATMNGGTSYNVPMSGHYRWMPSVGYNYAAWLQKSSTATGQYIGTNGGDNQTGFQLVLEG